jgi:methionyl-tRNA formyltransferase
MSARARPRAVFFGTPEFAATVLHRLLAPASPVQVVAVVTQPDRPVGRSQTLSPPPVKALALEHDVLVLQPATSAALSRPAASEALRRLAPDLGVVAANGRILPPPILAVPPHGYLNVHASLLPRWRGAWPAGAAILAGDGETGVSIMKLDEGMDTGPVLAQRPESIRPDDTTGALETRLAALGAALLLEAMPGYLNGTIVPQPQDDLVATYCHPVRKVAGVLDWSESAAMLERRVRAYQPWPVASTPFNGKQLQVLEARAILPGAPAAPADGLPQPGTVVPRGKGAAVVTGEGLLELEVVRLEGRNPTPVASFVNGYRTFVGSRLGG